MTNVQHFNLPDVGEGLTEAEIVAWRVAPGDTVEVNQVIVEIETAKSLVELPSPFAGTVQALIAEVGQTVDVGSPIIAVETGPADEAEPKLLVGYGAKQESGTRRRRRGAAAPAPVAAAPAAPVSSRPVLTKPPVRKLASVLGVDLTTLVPSGPGGTVTRADVMAAAEEPTAAGPAASDGDIRIPIKGVRKVTAAAMVSSAFTAPHVTEFVTLDVSATMELKARIAARRDFSDVRLSPLTFVARAFLHAIERTPAANSRWDEEAQEIVQMREVNLGIAAATPRGLVVPNIRGAQRMGLRGLAEAIADLASTARAGKTPPEAMAHGTVTISNFGVFGVDTGTPILNPGETAILGVGSIERRPWVVGEGADERIEPRWVTTLALSFDHRVMDGQQGSELLADTAAFLRDPALSVL